ncbi:acetylserotonin O-methyltransferase [Pseudonocardia humida]|uniref:Methyltransferase n=1 Tax=Pseudonocardia humida TaxID=2800819 RepID=A0ABT0ZRZ0_9PSEU|nr:acetylserotonin O-methyltransferase [Pseudonocardia humida]MCO1653491.1 methyltransferase [Pseudonocardia humida]
MSTATDRAALSTMLWGFFPAQVIQTLAALGVPDALGERPHELPGLAGRTGADEQALGRLLRAGAGLGLLDRQPDGCWRLTPVGDLLRTGVPGSMGNLSRLFCGGPVWRSWGELEWSVRTGRPSFEEITGRSAFEYMAADPPLLAVFTEAMAEGTRMAAPGAVASCDLDGVDTLVDVGGGNGTLLAAFLAAHPDLRGILFDTPAGVHGAADVLDPARAEVVTGDMFDSVPRGDAHVVKSVVHDWSDERAVALLTRVREAMPPHGVLHLVEPVLAEDPAAWSEQSGMLMSDLNMLVAVGGRERTLAEFTGLLDAAGLRLTDVVRFPPPTGYSTMRAVPA